MRFLLSLTLVAGLAAPAVDAQCGISSAQFNHYGTGCNPVFQNPPVLVGSYDATNCTLTLDIQAFPGCCNTFLRSYLMAFGTTRAFVQLPQIGQGCTLLVGNTFAALFRPANLGSTVSIVLPRNTPAGSFTVQGAAHYFTTIGFSNDLALTDAALVTLQ